MASLGNADTTGFSKEQISGMRGFSSVTEMDEYDAKKRETVDDTKKETSSNNDQEGTKKKTYSYPLARRNDSATDYLQIEISEYQAPGLKLPAFEGTKDKDGNFTKITGLNATRTVTNKAGDEVGTFALQTGSAENRKNKKIKYKFTDAQKHN